MQFLVLSPTPPPQNRLPQLEDSTPPVYSSLHNGFEFMMDLNCLAEFDAARDADFFSSLPAAPAVARIEPRADFANAHPYLIRTADLRARMKRLLASRDEADDPAESRRLHLRDFAGAVRYRVTGSPFEQSVVMWHAARELDPRGYHQRLRMRAPALLKINLANAYPRCYVTRRIRTDENGAPSGGFYFGPFPSRRAADAFSSEFLNLFKIRRCQIKIRRDPTFPGCIYSEMKMCLAPCFAGCTAEEYAHETTRVVNFLSSTGDSLSDELEIERETASVALDFERAASVHRRLEKVAEVLRGMPEVARRIEELDAVILQRAVAAESVQVFIVRGGRIADFFALRFSQTSKPGSVEEALRERLGSAATELSAAKTISSEPLADHLALLARWFYSKPRLGEIFFRDGDWPYRRLIRACGRVLQGKTTGESGEAGVEKKE
jgi:excinuclease ABC subunit C